MADEKKYQVFISSTFTDLQKERRALQDLLLSKKYVPVGMETFLGSHRALPQYLKDLIDACDYYVVIVAGRYGSKPKGSDKSWTELEYDYAASTDIPILAFFKSSDQDYTDEIKNFMDKISENCTPTYWTDKGDLAGKVFRQLTETETPRPGWVRADMQRYTGELAQAKRLEAQLASKESELALANAEIDALKKRPPDDIKPPPLALEVGKPYPGTFGKGDWEWLVLNVDKQNNRALLITEDIIETRAYNEGGGSATWAECSLQRYLNGDDFKKNFSDEEWKKKICETENKNENNPWYGTKGGDPTTDKVFLLSIGEVADYLGLDKKQLDKKPKNAYRIDDQYNSKRVCKFNDNGIWWWLRLPGDYRRTAAGVDSDGDVDLGGRSVASAGGVRPALWLNL